MEHNLVLGDPLYETFACDRCGAHSAEELAQPCVSPVDFEPGDIPGLIGILKDYLKHPAEDPWWVLGRVGGPLFPRRVVEARLAKLEAYDASRGRRWRIEQLKKTE